MFNSSRDTKTKIILKINYKEKQDKDFYGITLRENDETMLNENIRPMGLAHLTLIYQCLKDLPFEVLKNIAFELMSNNCNKSNSTIQNLV